MYANEARPVHRFCLPALGPPPHPSIQHTPTTGPAMVLWRCLLSPQCQKSRRTPTLLRHTTTTVVMARIQKQQIQPAAASQGTISCLCLKIPACRFPWLLAVHQSLAKMADTSLPICRGRYLFCIYNLDHAENTVACIPQLTWCF